MYDLLKQGMGRDARPRRRAVPRRAAAHRPRCPRSRYSSGDPTLTPPT